MQKYPTLKVVIAYPLLGGLVGSLLCLPFAIFSILREFNYHAVLDVIFTAWVVGFIPALLTGIVLAYFKIRILTKMDYSKAFWVGFGVTFLCLLVNSIIGFITDSDKNIGEDFLLALLWGFVVYILVSLIGGMSSIILAKFILPKS